MKKLLMTTVMLSSFALTGLAYAADSTPSDEGHSFFNGTLEKLPEQKAAAFKETMKEARETNKALMEQTKKLHEDLRAIIIAPTFDKAAFVAKDKELQEVHDKMAQTRSAAFADALSGLTQEERTTLADSMKERHDKMMERWKERRATKAGDSK